MLSGYVSLDAAIERIENELKVIQESNIASIKSIKGT